ncbi:MAG: PLP-dependent aminotransferase family protein [Mycobacterium sp.]|nr:PLP-dependent aminotransferase family protein [Mycobacterium sp.]
MDQNVWWSTVALQGWSDRRGTRYQKLAEAVHDAIGRRLLIPGQRVPAERVLADLVGVSRGTVVRAFEELVAAGLLERIQGSGTYVRMRSGEILSTRSDIQPEDASDRLDFSRPGPASPHNLPRYDAVFDADALSAVGDPAFGISLLRNELAHYMSEVLGVPTERTQIFVTSGNRESVKLLWSGLSLAGRAAAIACPSWLEAVPGSGQWARRVVALRTDGDGLDVDGAARHLRRAPESVLVLSTTNGPAGIPLAASRRHRLAHTLERGTVLAIEDISDAAHHVEPDGVGAPLCGLSDKVVAVGELDRMLHSGLGIGWIRMPQPQLANFRLPERFRSPGVPSQLLAARALRAADGGWFADLRARSARQRTYLVGQLAQAIPSWAPEPGGQGPGLWVRLPVPEASSFTHVARRFGVQIGDGAQYCVDGAHHDTIWLSTGHEDATVDLAVDRLTAAWHEYTHRVAATV